MLILQIILYIVITIFALIFLILCVKIKIGIEVENKDIKVYFCNFLIYPMKKKAAKISKNAKQTNVKKISAKKAAKKAKKQAEKAKKAAEKKAKKQAAKKAKQMAKKSSKSNDDANIEKKSFDFKKIDYILSLCFKILDTIDIDKLYLDIIVATDDASKTAKLYGNICAIAGLIFPYLKKKTVKIDVDFDSSSMQINAIFYIQTRLIKSIFVLICNYKLIKKIIK